MPVVSPAVQTPPKVPAHPGPLDAVLISHLHHDHLHKPSLRGLSTTARETLVTSVLDAQPELRFDIPGPSPFPFLLSLCTAVMFIAGIFTPWAILIGAILAGIVLAGWFFGDPNYKNKTARETGERSESARPATELRPKEV